VNPARKAVAAVLLWIAGWVLTGSASTALKVFADYKDSPDSTYLFFAGVELVIAVGLIAIGFGLLLVGSQPDDRRDQAVGRFFLWSVAPDRSRLGYLAPNLYRRDAISSLKEIRDDCLNRRGIGRTRPGPGTAPPALAEAVRRFLPSR
jgi:hypothetical protein